MTLLGRGVDSRASWVVHALERLALFSQMRDGSLVALSAREAPGGQCVDLGGAPLGMGKEVATAPKRGAVAGRRLRRAA